MAYLLREKLKFLPLHTEPEGAENSCYIYMNMYEKKKKKLYSQNHRD